MHPLESEKKENNGKGGFFLQVRHESESKGNNKLKPELFGLGKIGGYTHSDTDLGICSDHGVDPDPHRSTRIRTDPDLMLFMRKDSHRKGK